MVRHMLRESEYVGRPLSRRESQIVAWLEEERPPLVNADGLSDAFRLPRHTASDVLRRMARKGWLQRVSQGSYEPLLAESGGIALPNPWAALASWGRPYYVSYGSAAYELGLTPDRPGAVQACVRFGTRAPARFADLPLTLIPQRHFSLDGTVEREIRGQAVLMASPERTVIDAAIRPARVGGTIPLARIAHRAAESIDWRALVALADRHPRGHPAARRLAALLTVLGQDVPRPLARYAGQGLPARPMLIGDRRIYGSHGPVLGEWAVRVNVPEEALREEARR